MSKHTLRVYDYNHQMERVCITLSLQIENFLLQKFNTIKMGIEQALIYIYGYQFWNKINGLVDLEIFLNKNQAIYYAVTHYYFIQNKILGD